MIAKLTNQGFIIELEGDESIPNSLLYPYQVYSFKKNKNGVKDINHQGYTYTQKENSFYFPMAAKGHIIGGLKQLAIKMTYEDLRDDKKYHTDLNFISPYDWRDNQKEYADEMVSQERRTYLLGLDVGFGKTYILTRVLSIINERFLLIIKPGYIDKWKKDLEEYLGLGPGEVYIFSGKNSFKKYLDLPKRKKKDYKAFIISTMTSNNYFKSYDNGVKLDIQPKDFLKVIKANVMVSDEVHQHYDAIFEATIRFNPRIMYGLSATLLHKDVKRQRLYDLLFPTESRLDLKYYKPHLNLVLANYIPINPKQIKYKRFSMGYNQIMLEQSIVNNRSIRDRFYRLINKIIEEYYINKKEPGDKCLILCASRDLCTNYSSYLSVKYPDLDVRRNMGDDSYDDLMDGEVLVATNGRASTGVDIKGLKVMINLIASDSIQFNIQAPGRLRKRDGVELYYIQAYSKKIPQHKRYIKGIEEHLSHRYKTFDEIDIGSF